ncbi:MAG: heat-inducible transcriptional repressor HrcA [Alphaproteobacteria bacterium]|nr:heat-inducible transcriptional repressor HrcA [Alphaproteobacteria bacterium]
MRTETQNLIADMSERTREIFRRIVEAYVESGEPVGSRTLARQLSNSISPATIRNVMADLEDMGLLFAPHTSAGRLPTEAGLRLFVDGLLEVGDISDGERHSIESYCAAKGRSFNDALAEATAAVSGLSRCASVVVVPKADRALKHVEFVHLGDGRALVVLVSEDGQVENRVIAVPAGTPPSALVQATNYLNARLVGRTIDEARGAIQLDIEDNRAALDQMTSRLVEAGLAVWSGEPAGGLLVVRGQANLLNDVSAETDLARIRHVFAALETRDLSLRLLDLANHAEGVQIFIGAENALFNLAGCSMIVAPFGGDGRRIVGAIGVIGPTRINYARIVPIVDYTAKLIGRLVG